MTTNEYTAGQALELLMTKLRALDETLANQVQAAIDAGRDVQKTEPAQYPKKKPRSYRKQEPFSSEDALREALKALQAFFVEQPLFANSALDSIANAALGEANRDDFSNRSAGVKGGPTIVEEPGREKRIEIALSRDTQIPSGREEQVLLARNPSSQIDTQRLNLYNLRRLVSFEQE